jgi:hypothetical protein
MQAGRSDDTTALLREYLSKQAVGVVRKVIHWFAFSLREAGLELRVRERRMTYMH